MPGNGGCELKDAKGQSCNQSLQQHLTLNPCRLNPHIWTGKMSPRESCPAPGAAHKHSALQPAQSPLVLQEWEVPSLPVPLEVYFGQTVILKLNLATRNYYFLEQLLGNPQSSNCLQTLLSVNYSLAWIKRSCRSTQSQTRAAALNLKQGTRLKKLGSLLKRN